MSVTAIWIYSATTLSCSATVLDINSSPVSPVSGTNYNLAEGLYSTSYSASISVYSGDSELQRVSTDHKTTPWPIPPKATDMMEKTGITQEQVDSLLGSTGAAQQAAARA